MVEADEYAGNFDPYRPAVAVLTSAEWDHPDVFADREAVVDCYVGWLEIAAREVQQPLLVANVADPGVLAVVERLGRWPGRVLCAALGDLPAGRLVTGAGPAERLTGRVVKADPEGTVVRLDGAGLAAPLEIRVGLPGRHNAANALGVAGAALALGVAPDRLALALGSFSGVGRRLERKGEGRGVVVYDDYGHHPTAIRETLAACARRSPAGASGPCTSL